MKAIITSWLVLFMAMITFAQTRLIPGKNSFEKKWIKSGAYQTPIISNNAKNQQIQNLFKN